MSSAPPQRITKTGYTALEVRRALSVSLFSWGIGAAFFAVINGPVFTYFLTKYLHTSDTVFGLITGLGAFGVLFQLLGSYVIERTGHIKRNFVIFGILGRLPWLAVAAIPLCCPVREGMSSGGQSLVVLLACTLCAMLINFGGAGWAAWIAAIVPSSVAGKFFGYRIGLGQLSSVLTASMTTLLLMRYVGEGWIYAVIFTLAALAGIIEVVCYLPVRQIPRPIEESPPTPAEIVTTPWRNALFLRYSLYTLVTWISYTMLGPFLWRFFYETKANHGLEMSVFNATLLLYIVPTILMAWASPIWGRAVDRFGCKPVLAASALGQILPGIPWAIMRPDFVWAIPLMMLVGGLMWPGIDQVNMYMQVREFPELRRTTFNAMSAIVVGLASTIGPIFGGLCAGFWQQHLHQLSFLPSWISHYHLVFLTGMVIRTLTLLLLLPRIPLAWAAGTAAVTRSVAADLISTIPGLNGRSRKPSPARPRVMR